MALGLEELAGEVESAGCKRREDQSDDLPSDSRSGVHEYIGQLLDEMRPVASRLQLFEDGDDDIVIDALEIEQFGPLCIAGRGWRGLLINGTVEGGVCAAARTRLWRW